MKKIIYKKHVWKLWNDKKLSLNETIKVFIINITENCSSSFQTFLTNEYLIKF